MKKEIVSAAVWLGAVTVSFGGAASVADVSTFHCAPETSAEHQTLLTQAGGARGVNEDAAPSGAVLFADPTVVVVEGRYYLTGTRKRGPDGFRLLESDDLVHWRRADGTSDGFILKKGESCWGTKGFWAPQLFKEGDRWWFAYTANEQVALASCGRLTGSYTQETVAPLDPSGRNIDPFFFKDDDGKWYLYYVRLKGGNRIWAAEFDWTTKKVKSRSARLCFDPTEPWEHTPAYPTANGVIEGPTVIKRGGLYHLFYSCNHYRSVDYAVGFAVSESPLGPWRKFDGNPIISRQILGDPGAGHGDLFVGRDGKTYYVYHAHNYEERILQRQTKIVELLPENNFRPNPSRPPLTCVFAGAD